MGMIQTDDFLIRVTKVCPPGFNFNIGNRIELTILIYGSFRNLVSGTECILCIEPLTGNGFSVTAYIDGFSVSGTGYMLAVLLCHFKSVIRAFPAKVSLDNEKAVCIHQNSNIVDGVISRIKADQQWLICQFVAKIHCFLQEFNCPLLAVLFSFTEFEIDGIPLGTDICHHRRIAVKTFVGARNIPFWISNYP